MLTLEQAQALPLWDRQIEIETEMRSYGIDRFRKAALEATETGQETRIAPVRRLLGERHRKMVEAIQAFYGEVEAKKAGRKHSAYDYLKAVEDDDLVAHLTCRIILDMLSKKPSLTHAAVLIAEALEDELNYEAFREQHEAGFLKSMKRTEKTTNRRFRKKSVLGAAKKLGVDLLSWPKTAKVLVGSKLVELFVGACGVATMVTSRDHHTLEMLPEARQWVDEECRRSEWLSPMYLPCVIPPRPWTGPFEGGYWSGRARRLTLVKTANRAYLEELRDHAMPEVYTAINALQGTAWAVNTKVLGVMEYLWDNPSTLGMIPEDKDDLPLPEKPLWLAAEMTKETMTEDQLNEFRAWKSECVRVREEQIEKASKRFGFGRMLWVANRYREGEFFFPYQLDWRGRAYPVSLYLQPQGNDAQRALLEFSSVCPIHTQEQADWLAIHGAGCWGVDKVSMPERVQWVLDHEEAILASARDPYENRFWTEADKPWCALAFAFDWLGFREHGWGYESALPCQMDGTCNGLQQFSAILRDEIGGAAVNLVPADKPQDIYQRVADLVSSRVMREAAEGNELAAGWVGNVDRKVCKRPVMTLAYGARKYGFTDQVFGDTIRPWRKDSPATFPFGHQGWQAAQYMAGLIWDATGEVVVAARAAMDWLQEAARVVSAEKLPIMWTTPSGFRVQQAYRLRDMQRIELAFQTIRLRLNVDRGSEKLDTRKQASGISPNWVHSLDASHLTRTICAATCAGVESFSFIHDSYGTHAGNAPALAILLREEFVRMYEETDVLAALAAELGAVLPEGTTLPPLPETGSLDLSCVLESPFFFA